jgi:hypothetical protein
MKAEAERTKAQAQVQDSDDDDENEDEQDFEPLSPSRLAEFIEIEKRIDAADARVLLAKIEAILETIKSFGGRLDHLNLNVRNDIAEAIQQLAKALGFRFEGITFDDGGFSMATPKVEGN